MKKLKASVDCLFTRGGWFVAALLVLLFAVSMSYYCTVITHNFLYRGDTLLPATATEEE